MLEKCEKRLPIRERLSDKQLNGKRINGRREWDRTTDHYHVKVVLYH